MGVAIGTVAGWATVGGLLLASWVFWRGGGGTAIASLETANRVLEKRVQDLENQSRRDNTTIAELRGRTDISIALKPILEWTVQHETRAQERHEKTLVVLDLIAQRLGPDENGNGHKEEP
jgi:hypothetical protein